MRWLAVGKRVMSTPISATMTLATMSLIHLEPVGELEERPCRRTEATDFAMLRLAHASYAGDDDVFVHVEARTARVQYFHFASSQRAGRSPRFRNLLVVLRD